MISQGGKGGDLAQMFLNNRATQPTGGAADVPLITQPQPMPMPMPQPMQAPVQQAPAQQRPIHPIARMMFAPATSGGGNSMMNTQGGPAGMALARHFSQGKGGGQAQAKQAPQPSWAQQQARAMNTGR